MHTAEDLSHANFQSFNEQDEETEEQTEQLEFNVQRGSGSMLGVMAVCAVIVILLFVLAKLALVISTQRPNISIPPSQFSQPTVAEIPVQDRLALMTSPSIVLQTLSQEFVKIELEDITLQQTINAQKINEHHVYFKRSLRKSDFEVAQLKLSGIEDDVVYDSSKITYGQFLMSLGLLQLTTFPPNVQADRIKLAAEQKSYYNSKWALQKKEANICAVMLLSAQGLKTGSYYYALRSLFQQNYNNLKIILIDNTPRLGLQAQVLGLVKGLDRNKKVIILDRRVKGGFEGSSIYLALHKYCETSELFILLRDSGELIGQHAFSLLNSVHTYNNALVVSSHYILDMGSSFVQLDDFRYKIQIYEGDNFPQGHRSALYKTKYIKSYSTQLLLSLPLQIFHNRYGHWLGTSFEAILEFSSIQKSCGKHFIVPQILYRAPISLLQDQRAVSAARKGPKLECGKTLHQTSMNMQLFRQFVMFENNLIENDQIQNMGEDDTRSIHRSLILYDRQRTKQVKIKIAIEAQALDRTIGSEKTLRQCAVVSLYQLTMGYRVSMYTTQNLDLPQEQNHIINFEERYLERITTLRKDRIYGAVGHHHMNHSSSGEISVIANHKQDTFFCILLLTQNNIEDHSYFYSLESILKQKYSSYRLVILDNASTDQTEKLTKRHILNIPLSQRKRVHLYAFKQKVPFSQTLYFGVRKFCQLDEVLLVMTAGDQLVGGAVLQQFNEQYRHGNILAAYSRSIYIEGNSWSFGISQKYDQQMMQERSYRQYPLYFGPLRTFKVELFIRLQQGDFKVKDIWTNNHQVWFNISYGIMQLACGRVAFIDPILFKQAQSPQEYPTIVMEPLQQSIQEQEDKQIKKVTPSQTVSQKGPKYECFRQGFLSLDP